MNKPTYHSWLAGAVSLCYSAAITPSQAQITNDGTLSTNITTPDNLNFTITSGNQAEGNLFHSFREFSVPMGGSAAFDNALNVQNIISRVTGSSISDIEGLIQANGSANLFLINPNGIIFGRDAKLDIGGSFIASTASRLNFADGSFFSAIDTQAQPLLTVSVPVGLQFGATVGSIVNRSRDQTEDSSGLPIGLQVQSGKTLALVGSDVLIEGGALFAPGGRIELGSVAGSSLVNLKSIATGWNLEYDSVQNFGDIQLSQASVYTGGNSLGDIWLRGRRIVIASGSQVGGINFGANPGGTIVLKASESVEVSRSILTTSAFSAGAAGDIKIATKRLLVSDQSFIDALSISNGRGGNIAVDASESVEVNGNGRLTQITSQAFASGKAGDVEVKTGKLILKDGGQISSSVRTSSIGDNRGEGNGGTVIVDAFESVEASGQGEDPPGRVRRSGLLAETREQLTTGNGGNLKINTGRLVVADGASISVAAVDGSAGQAGSLDINASKSVEISGIGSTLLATSESPKPAGNLTISTDKMIVRDGAKVNVSSLGTGDAGNLNVTANSIRLDNGGITATSASGESGNIELSNLDLLLLRDNSEIATDATAGTGNGGNITIYTDLLVGLRNSDITATAIKGRGGNIQINTQGIFGIEPRSERTPESDITASSELGVDGIVEINRPDVDPTAELVVLPAEIVDVSGLIAQGCPAGGGNVVRGSEFVVTGRGGLPPTPTEATRSDSVLADLGSPVQNQENRTSAAIPDNTTSSDSDTLVEAQGWVIGSKGEVVLTASAPIATPDIPWLTPTSCHG